MPTVPFTALPDAARAWVFGSCQPILGEDAEKVVSTADAFVRGWLAHGAPVVGGLDWRYDHFLVIAADEEATGVSGCSVDALYRMLREVEREQGVCLLDASRVWFRGVGGAVQVVTRSEFRELVGRGEVNYATTVFDNTVGTVGQIRRGEWERPFVDSWHRRAFVQERNLRAAT